jgi:hypothetical protein
MIDSNAGGVAEAFKYVAAGSGPVGTLSIYVEAATTASQVAVGLYTSNPATDRPSLLLTQATISAPVRAAWNTVALPAASVTAGNEYWIAVLGRGGSVHFRDAVSGGSSQTHAQTGLSLLPSTWVTGARFSNSPMSAYVRSP